MRRASLTVAFVGLNLMACCCGGGGPAGNPGAGAKADAEAEIKRNGKPGAAAYEDVPEPRRSRLIKEWEGELAALKRAIKDDEERLRLAKTPKDRQHFERLIGDYKAKLAKHEKNDPPYDREGEESRKKNIVYEVLKNKKRGDGKVFLDVLVSETASKQDVLRLAESLRREHAGKFATIGIYDSREAFQRQADEAYPEKDLLRHSLVVISGDLGEEIRWIGEGRDH